MTWADKVDVGFLRDAVSLARADALASTDTLESEWAYRLWGLMARHFPHEWMRELRPLLHRKYPALRRVR